MVKNGVGLHARPVGRRAQRHHPQHGARDLRATSASKLVEKRITRDEVYICRRGLLHRHRRRSDADPRARPHRDRRRLARPDHREDPERVLRHRRRQAPQYAMADPGLTRTRNHAMKASASASSCVELDGKDLPAFCPNPAMPLWATIRASSSTSPTGEAKCPYCGTEYRLKPGAVVKATEPPALPRIQPPTAFVEKRSHNTCPT